MATALARVAIAWFGQHSVRPQRALRVKAPEDARVNALRVRVGFDPDEHVFAAQRRTEVRTIRIQIMKFSHNDLHAKWTGLTGFFRIAFNLAQSCKPCPLLLSKLPPAESRV